MRFGKLAISRCGIRHGSQPSELCVESGWLQRLVGVSGLQLVCEI